MNKPIEEKATAAYMYLFLIFLSSSVKRIVHEMRIRKEVAHTARSSKIVQ